MEQRATASSARRASRARRRGVSVTSPRPSGPNGEHLAGVESRRVEDEAVPRDRPRARRETGALLQPPQLLAGERIVSVRRHRSRADQHRLSADRDDLRRRERLAEIAVRLDLAVRVDVLEIHRPRRLPHRLARPLVERDDVLHVAAVEVHDEQVAEEDRRRAGAAEVVALEIAALPDHLAGRRVDRGRAGRPERHVDAAGLDHRRRRGVGVERVRELRRRDVEQLQVVQRLAGVLVERHREQLLAVRRRGRQPDLLAEDDRRRPGAAVDRHLPAHVLGFTPLTGTSALADAPVPSRSAELRPLARGDDGDEQDGATRPESSRPARTPCGPARWCWSRRR